MEEREQLLEELNWQTWKMFSLEPVLEWAFNLNSRLEFEFELPERNHLYEDARQISLTLSLHFTYANLMWLLLYLPGQPIDLYTILALV